MKLFLALGVAAVFMAGVAWSAGPARVGGSQFGGAQFGGRTSALGGPTASRGALTHSLGGFSSPGIGFNRGNRSFRGTREGRDLRPYIYPYGYSYYVPGYFDYLDSNAYFDPSYSVPPASAASYGQIPAEPSVSQQPVIINQYFGVQGPQTNQGPESVNDAQTPADAIAPSSNYYLIAYKNHSVYPALAYWVEDKTLHYVTTQNTHNQASLDLIDLALTKSLNQTREVPFSIPGQ